MLETVSAGEGLTGKMKKLILLIFCLVLAGSIAGTAWASYYDPYAYGSGYGYGYGSMSGYPAYGTGSTDLNGYTLSPSGSGYYPPSAPGSGYYTPSAPGSGYYSPTSPGTGSILPRYTITYLPGSGGTGTSFTAEWYPGDAIIAGQGFSRPGHTQTGWSFYDGGPMAFYLGQHITISTNMVLYPYWERNSNTLYLTVNYSGYGAVRLSGGNVPNGWTGKLEPGQSFNFIFQPYEGYYVYSILLAGWYRNVQYGNQFMVTYDMLQGQNQVMTVRFESIYLPPKTGDDGNVALWTTLSLLAALGAGTVIYRLKKAPNGMIKVLCLLLAIFLVPCICGAEADAILDASTVFGGSANTIEQPVVPYTSSTPTPETFSAGSPSRETVNPAAGLPVSNAYNAYGVTNPSGTAQYAPMTQEPSAQGESSITISLLPVEDSSIVSAAGYHEGALILAVQMRGTGEIRCYRPVSKIIYLKFLESAAKDTYFAGQIESRYERIQ